MQYHPRQLLTRDIFALAKVLQKLDFETIKKNIDFTAPPEEVGGALIFALFKRSDDVQSLICQLLGDILGIPADDVLSIPLADWPGILKELGKDGSWANFMQQVKSTM